MERAALAVAEKAEEILKKEQAETVWSVCGFGNNGADGVAAARMLFLKGYDVKILFPGRDGKGSEELEVQLNIVKRLGIPVMTAEELPDAEEKRSPAHPFAKTETKANACRGVILDAVFGIGLSRNVEGAYKKLIDWINRREDMKTIAVDIPSGISSDTGEVMGDAVRADVTVTFGMKKLGQVLFPGREYCGELLVRDVGFVPESSAEQEKHVQMLDREDLLRIPERTPDSNKGTYGKVLVMAGAKNMAGAACLSARAAYRMGAGLVKIFTPEENRIIVQEKLPEAILSTYDAREAGKDPESFARKIARETEWADVIVLGPGIGMEDHARLMVENVLKDAYVPIILDADALNLAAEYREFTWKICLTAIRLFYRKYHRDAAYEGNVAAHRNSDRGDQGKSDPCGERVCGSVRSGLRLKGLGDRDRGKRRKDLCQWQRDARYGKRRFRGCSDRCDRGTDRAGA